MDPKSSPFYHLLDTNYAASRAEAEHINEILRPHEQDLRNIDEEIARLDTLLEDLRSQREKVVSYIHKHRQLLSPIRRLPPEILADSFTYCLPVAHPPTRDLSEAPLLLTLVSKQWREIAFSTPYLWSALHIYIPHSRVNDEEFMERRKNGIKQWLERSGNLPISLSLTHRCPVYGPDNQESLIQSYSENTPLSSLMECLMEYSPRWKDLTLIGPRAALQLIGALPPEKLTVLQRLFIYTLHPYSHLPFQILEESFVAFLDRLPRLTSLHLREPSILRLQSGFQWSKLTELSLLPGSNHGPVLFHDAMKLLSQTSNLRVCKLMIRLNAASTANRVTLPFLHDLTLIFYIHDEPPLVLAHSLTAPSLAKLAITGPENMVDAQPFFRDLLLKLLGESSTSIQTLHIAVVLPFPDLVRCLRLAPRLKSLIIGSVWPGDRWNRSSISFPGGEVNLIGMLFGEPVAVVDSANAESQSLSESLSLPLCPELQILKLLKMEPLPTPSVFLNLIRLRQESLYSSQTSDPNFPTCHVLRTLEVFYPTTCNRYDASPETMEAFERLREEGMNICIAYSGWSNTEANNDDLPWDGFLDRMLNGELVNSLDTWNTKTPANERLVYI
ncbi:hypothetical protein K435DRAFT_246450 [Dendrothele bispora CBS 962.96]|uniref:Uncharacterized protein n=1 Tax=Dendrothele bispora (strain CBS 962.96) TaxID=1314807 RepID=A0A4S8LNL3_DENBC|nr:hypothetical protein K435DRAFT_246450 [Dendrothele bispora CBS 962.96]